MKPALAMIAFALSAASLAPAFAQAAPAQAKKRSDIAAECKWDFSAIYPSWEGWEKVMTQLQLDMNAFAAMKCSLAQGPQALLKAYRALDDIGKRLYLTYRYPQLERDVESSDQAVSGRFPLVGAVFTKFEASTAWFMPELVQVPQDQVKAWLDATPELAPYRFPILDTYRRQAHVLNEGGERLLALSSQFCQMPGAAYSQLSTTDVRFPTEAQSA